MENRIVYDWVTFTSKIDSPSTIIDLLGIDGVTFISLEHGMNGYPYCIYCDGISICYGGRDDMGVCCNMSGQGCRTFEQYGNGDYKSLFETIIDHYSDDADKREMNLTRLDVAYDDFENILPINEILMATVAGGYDTDLGRLRQGNFVTRFSKYDVDLGSDGICCGFGSPTSDTYIRIYDKRAEQNRYDLDHWVRCEIQLRRQNAMGFVMLAGDIATNYFGVVNNYLRFVKPSADTNKRRWEMADWWAAFLETVDRLKIFQRPGVEYDICCLDGYVYGQCAASVATMIELVGLDAFISRLRDELSVRKLDPKYRSVLSGRQCAGIFEFLHSEYEKI